MNAVTKQPVKGRKVGGGIRLGEMERDSLLAHGCSFLLHDRLFRCSDASNVRIPSILFKLFFQQLVCSFCGSILAAQPIPVKENRTATCRSCQTDQGVKMVELPVVFKYLATELAAMNMRLTLEVQ